MLTLQYWRYKSSFCLKMETVNPKNVNEIRCFDPSIEDLRSKDEGLITDSFVEQVT